jgi:cytochrome P450
VLVRQAKGYHKTGILKADPILAGGLIGLDLPEHLAARRSMPAGFGKQAINVWVPMIVAVIEKHIGKWNGPRVEVGLESHLLSGDIGSRLLLGCEDAERNQEITTLLRHAHQYSRRELRARYRRWPWVAPRWVPLRRRRRYVALREKITAWLQRHMEAYPAEERQDVLSMMRRAAPERDKDIAGLVDAIFMMYLAAKDPVANAMAWMLELLGDHPEVQARLGAEAERVLGEEVVRAEHVPRLTYATQVVNEMWRLYPSEWLITRRAVAEDRLPSGVRVRQGEEVMISPYLFGHDGRFFREPEKFDPERFAGAATWPAGAYMPFGAGPRSCLGEHLGRCILVIVAAMIARRYHIKPCKAGRGILESPNLFSSQPVRSRLWVEMVARESRAGGS